MSKFAIKNPRTSMGSQVQEQSQSPRFETEAFDFAGGIAPPPLTPSVSGKKTTFLS